MFFSNELLGIEGKVNLKNQEENLANGNHVISIDPKASNTEIDSKRFVELIYAQRCIF